MEIVHRFLQMMSEMRPASQRVTNMHLSEIEDFHSNDNWLEGANISVKPKYSLLPLKMETAHFSEKLASSN
jgi:hypothetical protein